MLYQLHISMTGSVSDPGWFVCEPSKSLPVSETLTVLLQSFLEHRRKLKGKRL